MVPAVVVAYPRVGRLSAPLISGIPAVVAYPRVCGLSAPLYSGIPAVVAYPRVGGLSAPLAGCSSPFRTLHTL